MPPDDDAPPLRPVAAAAAATAAAAAAVAASPARQHRLRDVHAYRATRVRVSLAHLRRHPAVNAAGPHASYVAPPAPEHAANLSPTSKPNLLLQTLFDDLVRRELGGDAANKSAGEQRALVDAHVARNRSVAPKPSLTDPHFVRGMCSGYDPKLISDTELLSKISTPTKTAMHINPSATEIHQLMEKANAQKNRLEKAAANVGTHINNVSTPMKRMRPREAAALAPAPGTKHAAIPLKSEPPEVTALRPTPDAVRRTRSASRRVRRASTNATSSECCFCPDPELFDGEELKSELIGPFVDRKGKAKLFVHFDCACWAPQVYTDSQTGQLRRVYDEYCRGRQLKCSECGGRGATIGCYVQRCKRVFHLRCLSRCGALRVERFFVAFCQNHAHLGKKRAYKSLMEAATIADVAAAHRREDSTFGLDAPHSRYTQLRRRETEVIFSRKWGVCSHTGAFESARVVFSHKRRAIVKKTDRLSPGDRTRSLLVSAFDIASGRLAYMSVAGKDKSVESMTAVEARAALASREHTSLMLLRNLRHSPRWTKDQIAVVKRASESGGETVKTLAKGSNVTKRKDTTPDGIGAPAGSNPNDVSGFSETRASKRRRINSSSSSGEELATTGQATEEGIHTAPSARLPSFKKVTACPEKNVEQQENLADQGGTPNHLSQRSAGNDENSEQLHTKSPKSAARRRRTGLSITKDGAENEVQNSRKGLDGKVKSAWETFLEEQLPKERLLRPDDPEADAMRNMARLWSLLSADARESYQERARCAGMAAADGGDSSELTQSKVAKSMNISDATEQNQSKNLAQKPVPRREIGLFAGRSQTGEDGKVSASNGKQSTPPVKKQPSVSLPRKTRVQRQGNAYYDELVAVDWDDLLPTTLDEHDIADSQSRPVERVRPPPSKGNKS